MCPVYLGTAWARREAPCTGKDRANELFTSLVLFLYNPRWRRFSFGIRRWPVRRTETSHSWRTLGHRRTLDRGFAGYDVWTCPVLSNKNPAGGPLQARAAGSEARTPANSRETRRLGFPEEPAAAAVGTASLGEAYETAIASGRWSVSASSCESSACSQKIELGTVSSATYSLPAAAARHPGLSGSLPGVARVLTASEICVLMQINCSDPERWLARVCAEHDAPCVHVRGQRRMTFKQYEKLLEILTCSPSVSGAQTRSGTFVGSCRSGLTGSSSKSKVQAVVKEALQSRSKRK